MIEHATKMRALKWGKRIAWTVGGLFVFFLVASNVMLRTRMFRDLMGFDPRAMTLEYRSAYSWFPGRIHAEGLSIRGSDSAVQWLLTVDRVDTFMNPFAFAKRRFSASHTTAEGVTFHLRTRHPTGELTPEMLASMPIIPGFAEAPIDVPVPPPPTDENYKLWSVSLSSVHAKDVTDVWVDTTRFRGHVDVEGRWLFRPLRELDLGPAKLEIHDLAGTSYGAPLVTGISGTVNVRVSPYDVRVPKGLDVLHQVSSDAVLSFEVPLSDAVNRFAGPSDVHFAGGVVRVQGEVKLARGVLTQGTKLRADVKDLDVAAGPFAAKTTSSVLADVDERETLHVELRSTDVHGSVLGRGAPADIADLHALVTTKHLDVAHGFDDAFARMEAHGVTTRSLEKWAAPKDTSSPWSTGTVSADVVLEGPLNEPDFRGQLDAVVKDASFLAGDARVITDVNVKTTIAHLAPLQKRFAAKIAASTPEPIFTAFDNLRVRAQVETSATLDLHADGPLAFELSEGEATWKNARADLSSLALFVAPEITVRATKVVYGNGALRGAVTVDVPRLDFADLSTLQKLLPFPDGIVVVGGKATASAHASLDLGTKTADGNFDLLARRVDVRLDKTPICGNLALRAKATAKAGGVTDFAGTSLTWARAAGADAPPVDPWSGTFTMPVATLSTNVKPVFHAVLKGQATDASPATLFVASATGIPGWVTNAFKMKGLTVSADVVLAPRYIAVRSLDARGDGSFVQAEYSHHGAFKDGAIYLGTGPLTAAIDLAGGSARLVLFGPQAWFLKDVEKIRANETHLE